MKKSILAAVFIILSGGIFAVDYSIGGGGLAGYTFTRYTMKGGDALSVQNMDRLNFAGFLFFDATYGELSVLIQGGNNSYTEKMSSGTYEMPEGAGTGSETSLGISLLGKYPFGINERITWFPMFGVEYQIALMQRRKPDGSSEYNRSKGKGVSATDVDVDGNSYPLSAWNSLWIDVGAGLDYTIAGPLFLRTELLFGFRLPTGYEMGALEMAKKTLNVDKPKLAGLTGGPSLKIAVGYRL